MLQELFYWVFNMSITAAITGVIIMLLRLVKKIPRRLTVFLWIIPFLRMVFPLGLNSPCSLMSLLSKITTKTIVVYQPADNVAFSMMNSVMAADTYFPTTYKVSYIFSDNNSRHGLPNTKRTRRTDCGVSEGVIVFKRDRCASHIGRVKRIYTVFLLTGTCISDSHSLSSSLFQTPSI